MSTAQPLRTPRLISLDVFRGITIALMILVNSPGNQTPYLWLEHSVWDGCTLADLVFPFFIVIVGISSALALSNLRAKSIPTARLLEKVLLRSAYIFLMGVFLNAFPYHLDGSSIRILGVLQRIAICYFFSSLLFLTTRIRTQVIIMVGLLLGYWILMTTLGPAGLTLKGNLVGYLDRLVFAPGYLYTPTFDPEGLLSTLPAIASALLGNLIGAHLLLSRTHKQQLQWMTTLGLSLALIGLVWRVTLPLNKALWSSSYVLWTGGLALLIFSAVYALVEIKQWKRWSMPFDCFGRHAMLVYVLHVFFLKIQAIIHLQNSVGVGINLRLYITELLFGQFTPQTAALFYAIAYTMFWLFVLTCLERWRKTGRRKVIIKQ